MPQRIAVVGLLALLALSLTSCGGDSPRTVAERQQQGQAQSDQSPQNQRNDVLKQSVGSQEREASQPSGSAESQRTEPADAVESPQVSQSRQQDVDASDAPEQQTDAPPEPSRDSRRQAEQQTQPVSKFMLGGERPAALVVPTLADRSQPRPLIVLLHGYGSNATEAEQYFRFSDWVEERGFGILYPNGMLDSIGARHWNATDECCDIFDAEVDDVAYIKSLIAEAAEYATFGQVFLVGHSNGGFMAYRLACEEIPGLAGIVSLAGVAHADPASCRAPSPLSVLQIHGTEDNLVLYRGGRLPTHPDPQRNPAPSAWESVTRWAERAGCDLSTVVERPSMNTDAAVEGDETLVKRYQQGCANDSVMELWTVAGGGHVPSVWGTQFRPSILDWIAERYARAEPASTAIGERMIGGVRPARLLFPTNADAHGIPLLLSLHGYSGEADAHDWYFGLSQRIVEYGFALITPQGTADERGYYFWNATDGCCNFYGSDIDDYGWLAKLVAEAREIIDISGVYAVGYSNGGFMAYRLACDGLDGLVAVASLAGSSFGDAARCNDTAPVSVLQIHGTSDRDIPYSGTIGHEDGYPGAVELTERWARRAGCDVERVERLPSIDLEERLSGAETGVQRFREGCADGVIIDLWTIAGADHLPAFADDWPDHLLHWLFNESRTN